MSPWTNLPLIRAPKVAKVVVPCEDLRRKSGSTGPRAVSSAAGGGECRLAKAVAELADLADEAVLEPHLAHQLAGAEVVRPLLDDHVLEEPEPRMEERAEGGHAPVQEPRLDRDGLPAVPQQLRRMVSAGNHPVAAAQRVRGRVGAEAEQAERCEQRSGPASCVSCHRALPGRGASRQPTRPASRFRAARRADAGEAYNGPRRRGSTPRGALNRNHGLDEGPARLVAGTRYRYPRRARAAGGREGKPAGDAGRARFAPAAPAGARLGVDASVPDDRLL